MTWTTERPKEPDYYWLAIRPEVRREEGAVHRVLVDVSGVTFAHGGVVPAEWLEGARYLPFEPPDPFAESVPTTPTAALVEEPRYKCDFCRDGRRFMVAVDAVNADGTVENPRPCPCIACGRTERHVKQDPRAALRRAEAERDEAMELGFALGCLLTNARDENEAQVRRTRVLYREARELTAELLELRWPCTFNPFGPRINVQAAD